MKIPYLDLHALNQRFSTEFEVAFQRVLSSGRYLQGEENAGFAQEFATYIGSEYCVPVSNGMDALTLIFEALMQTRGWEPGDEVIVPAFTFIASVEAVRRAGLSPVLCEVTNEGLLHIDAIPLLITSRTRAILPVHLYGTACDMTALLKVAEENALLIVEDAAQAHGARFDRRKVGTFGIASAFSFYPGKNLGALGDAGAVVTNDVALFKYIQALSNYGSEKKYFHRLHGHNMRMDEIQAAMLRIKLPALDTDNHLRREIANRYLTEIKHPKVTMLHATVNPNNVYHIFPIFIAEREKWQDYLEKQGIQTLIHYPLTIHQQESFLNRHLSFPIAERLASTCLSLPLHPLLTEAEVTYIVEAINNYPR